MSGLLARRRRRADLHQADAGPAGRDPALSVEAGRAARRRWSGIARPASTPTRAARREEFAAFCGQLRVGWHFCGKRDPQAKGVVERWQGYAETQLRARARVRQRARLPGPVRRLERRRSTRASTARPAARPIDRLAEELEVMAALPRGRARHRPALGAARRARSLRSLRRLRLLARSRISSAAASRSASATASSPRSRWTPASSPAGTRGRSPSTGRSPRSSTPARSNAAAAKPTARAAVQTRSLARL